MVDLGEPRHVPLREARHRRRRTGSTSTGPRPARRTPRAGRRRPAGSAGCARCWPSRSRTSASQWRGGSARSPGARRGPGRSPVHRIRRRPRVDKHRALGGQPARRLAGGRALEQAEPRPPSPSGPLATARQPRLRRPDRPAAVRSAAGSATPRQCDGSPAAVGRQRAVAEASGVVGGAPHASATVTLVEVGAKRPVASVASAPRDRPGGHDGDGEAASAASSLRGPGPRLARVSTASRSRGAAAGVPRAPSAPPGRMRPWHGVPPQAGPPRRLRGAHPRHRRRRRDAVVVPGVRLLGHLLPGPARRPRRPQAGAAPDPLHDERHAACGPTAGTSRAPGSSAR